MTIAPRRQIMAISGRGRKRKRMPSRGDGMRSENGRRTRRMRRVICRRPALPRPERPRLPSAALAFGGRLGLEQGGRLVGDALRGFRRFLAPRARSRRPACRPWPGTRPRPRERATSAVISTVTSGWRWTLILWAPSVLIGLSSSTWLRSILTPAALAASAMSREVTEP